MVSIVDDILYQGAVSFAVSLGKKLGENVADSLSSSLLGTVDQKVFNVEIISRLSRIEAKLDQIFTFLNSQLPNIVHDAVQSAIQKNEFLTLKNIYVPKLDASIQNYKHAITPQNYSDLKHDAEITLAQGYGVLSLGQQWYTSAFYTLSVVLPAYALLLGYDKYPYNPQNNPHYKENIAYLKSFLDKYISLLQSMINPQLPNTFKGTRDALEADFLYCQNMMKNQPPELHFLLTVQRQGVNTENKMIWYAYTSLLIGYDKNPRMAYTDRDATQIDLHTIPGAGLPSSECRIYDWWPPCMDIDPVTAWQEMYKRAMEMKNKVANYPSPTSTQCDISIGEITQLIDILITYKKLP